MSEVTNLRQAESKVEIEGILLSKDLEKITDKNGNGGVRGNVVIKVDDTNSIRIKVYVGEKKSNGEVSKAWEGINTVLNEYKSIADVGEENADRVHVNASFETYKNQNGQDVTTYSAQFFSRINRELVPKRKFSTEVFIKSKTWEVNSSGEDTGRLKIKGIAPSFKGIDILDMIAPASSEVDPNFAQTADSVFEEGCTYGIQGIVVNSRVEKKATAALGVMDAKPEYKNELIITGCTPAYDDDKAYDADAIKLAIKNYEDTQAAAQANRGEKAPFNKPSAAGTGRSLNF